MADEIKIALQESGLTVYAALRDEDGKVYNTSTSTFQDVDQITWSNADIGMSEQGSTGDYYGDMPASLSTAAYTIEIFEQVGASPVRKDDWLITSVPVFWDDPDLSVQLTPTQVRSEVDDALEAIKLHLLVNQAVATNDVVNNSIIARMASSATPADFDTFDNTNESLEAIGDAV